MSFVGLLQARRQMAERRATPGLRHNRARSAQGRLEDHTAAAAQRTGGEPADAQPSARPLGYRRRPASGT